MWEPGMNLVIVRAFVRGRLPFRGRRVPQLHVPMRPHPLLYRSGGIRCLSPADRLKFDRILLRDLASEAGNNKHEHNPIWCEMRR